MGLAIRRPLRDYWDRIGDQSPQDSFVLQVGGETMKVSLRSMDQDHIKVTIDASKKVKITRSELLNNFNTGVNR